MRRIFRRRRNFFEMVVEMIAPIIQVPHNAKEEQNDLKCVK